jgi:hypothetical protein
MTSTAHLMPTALRRTVACTIRKATEPGHILHQLIDAKPKMLVSIWCGTAGPKAEESDFDPDRGDGSTFLITQESPLYNLRSEPTPEHYNIQQGIPLWLLSASTALRLDEPDTVTVRGYGLLHPIFNSATIDYYSSDGNYEFRQYFHDPRTTQAEADRINEAEHFRRLQDMGAWIDNYQEKAPAWRPPCAIDRRTENKPLWQQIADNIFDV